MSRLLYRVSRAVCPAPDRPWLDALLGEIEAIDSPHARLAWLLGAAHVVLDRYVAAFLRPVNLLLLFSAVVFGWMAIIEYEGLPPEDDWYGPIAAASVAGWIAVSAFNLKRNLRGVRR
jgi:hypothetical protein